MRGLLVFCLALLPHCRRPCLSSAAEQFQPSTQTALTTEYTLSADTHGSYEESPEYAYILAIEDEKGVNVETVALHKALEEALQKAQEMKAAEKFQRKKNSAILAGFALVIPLVLSIFVHELFVYPKAMEIYESEGGRNLSEEQLYDIILEEDLPSSIAVDFISFLTVFLIAHFAYRVARVLMPLFSQKRSEVKLVQLEVHEIEQETPDAPLAAAAAPPSGH